MARQYSLEWLAQEGFAYSGYWHQMQPPNLLTYVHNDGRRAEMEDTREGYLLVDGRPVHSNRDALDIFSAILKTDKHL